MAEGRHGRGVAALVLAAAVGSWAGAAWAASPAASRGTLTVGVTVVAPCDAGASSGACAGPLGQRGLSTEPLPSQHAAPVAVQVGADPESGAGTLTVVY